MDIADRYLLADLDLGNLLYDDKAPLESNNLTSSDIQELTLSCTQNFLKQFWSLPTEQTDDVLVTLLPEPRYRLPREKQVPKARELTRWERFSRLKGITKHKKPRKVWDESSQGWKPRWGKDRIDNNKEKWVIEVPDNADPYEDQFEKATKERNERRAKNEFSRLKNIARSTKKGQAPPVGVQPEVDASKNHFNRALEIAKRSDASMGLFSAEINEQKIASKTEKKQKKRKTGGKQPKGAGRHAKGKNRGHKKSKK
uniref:Ribosome biogenesis regulatory protein n=1 Tax=Schistocephalus solidus TaxID=70667 RepID=A0A0X3P3U0_SCHSO